MTASASQSRASNSAAARRTCSDATPSSFLSVLTLPLDSTDAGRARARPRAREGYDSMTLPSGPSRGRNSATTSPALLASTLRRCTSDSKKWIRFHDLGSQ